MKTARDRELAIEGALMALVKAIHPRVQICDLQKNTRLIGEPGSGYTAHFDGKPLAVVDLTSKQSFRMTILGSEGEG